MNKIILFLFLVLFSMSFVSSLGVTPGRTTFDFDKDDPNRGDPKTVGFEVINSENKEMDIVILIQGELSEWISVSEVSFHMSADEESRKLEYILDLPEGLQPGLHTSEITILELPGKSPTSEAFVGSAVGVVTQIHVYVPFPGKFVEAALNVIGTGDDGNLIFVIPVVSRGDLDLARVRATIDIFTGLNEKIDTLNTNEVNLLSGERKEVSTKWDITDKNPGQYKAVATLIYDEQTLTVENEFSIGSKLLELLQVEVNNFVLGGIAKFELLVENKWSEEIIGAYARMEVFNEDNEVMADFKSAAFDIPSFEKKLLVAFWDTVGVKEGTYDSTLYLNYGSQSERQDLKLEVKEREINVVGIGYVISEDDGFGGENSLTIILVTAVVVLVIINILWFLVLRKRLKSRK